jgi:hypothetical protein
MFGPLNRNAPAIWIRGSAWGDDTSSVGKSGAKVFSVSESNNEWN